ncbi:MAG: hypothetical protein ACRENK_04845 [Gemmatimonadaceae bacterium]
MGPLSNKSQFQYRKLLQIARPASPLRSAADFILTVVGLRRVIRNDAEEFLLRLLEANTSRIQWDLEDRLAVARKELESAVRKVLVSAREVAEQALKRARETRDSGKPVIQARMAKFAELKTTVNEISRESLTYGHSI